MSAGSAEACICILQWKIECATLCLLINGELESPAFIADTLQGTKWSLKLKKVKYPDGEFYVVCYLHRKNDCIGPNTFKVRYQLGFLRKDGSSLKRGRAGIHDFAKADTCASPVAEKRVKIFGTDRDAITPEDTLTVLCGISSDAKIVNTKYLFARTVCAVNRRSFLWRIKKFSTYKTGLKNSIKDGSIQFDVFVNEGVDGEKTLALNVNTGGDMVAYFSLKTSIVDSQGEKENCGFLTYDACDLFKGVSGSLPFPRNMNENRIRYFPNDVLSLDCEYVYSCGDYLEELWSSERNSGMIFLNAWNELRAFWSEHTNVSKGKPPSASVLVSDLKSMYNDSILCDTEIRTSTRKFSAHKTILSSRSPVFRSMFSNDMKEKNCGYVEIPDFDADTVNRMLLYMYTDHLEDLHCESASKLYMIAEKYQILSLKSACSSFLKKNLCPTNACDILVLADVHSDADLKSAVQDYILGQKKQIFCSDAWKQFMDTHLKLASEVMYKKIYEE